MAGSGDLGPRMVAAASGYDSEHKATSFQVNADLIQQSASFVSEPEPPPALWDVADASHTDMVICKASIWIVGVDPKSGRFECRMRCEWLLRLVNLQERTEPRVRVPGIRMPRLMVHVDESRLWRELSLDTPRTICWQGMSVFSMTGFQPFQVRDFPFDRQVVNLDLMHFVWRRHKDEDQFEESMKVVHFTLVTTSVLPEFDTYHAIIEPRRVTIPDAGPTHCSRFDVMLRLERKHTFYILQILVVSWVITMVSCLAMALKPVQGEIGNKLPVIAGGVLTLLVFKYGVADSLPHVPYSTFTDNFLQAQLVTLVFVAIESVVSYKLVDRHMVDVATLNLIEDIGLALVCLGWLISFIVAVETKKRRRHWTEVTQGVLEQLKSEHYKLPEDEK